MRDHVRLSLLLLLVLGLPAVAADPIEIPIRLVKPERVSATHWPVSFGVPFAQGDMTNVDELVVVDELDQQVPIQTNVLGTWRADGSARWVLVHFTADFSKQYRIMQGTRIATSNDVQTTHLADGIRVDNGLIRCVFRHGQGSFRKLSVYDGSTAEPVVVGGGDAFYVIDSQGRKGIFSATQFSVEPLVDGPRHVVIKAEGDYRTDTGERNAQAVIYFHFYADTPAVRVSHRLIVSEETYDEHPEGGLWFRDIGIDFPMFESATTATFNDDHALLDATFTTSVAAGQTAYLVQDDFPHFSSTNEHYAIMEDAGSGPSQLAEGTAAGDWADLSSSSRGLAVQVPALAEQFPKAMRLSSDRFVVKLWASESGQELNYNSAEIIANYFGHDWIPEQFVVEGVPEDNTAVTTPNTARGSAKTHEVWLYPHIGSFDSSMVSQFGATREEIFAMADGQWIGDSGVMGDWHPYDDVNYPEVEEAIDDFFTRAIFINQQVFPVNGYLYYGMYPFVADTWEIRDGRWYPASEKHDRLARNLEYGLKRAVWILAARSADPKYFNYARRYTRLLGNLMMGNADDGGYKRKGYIVGGLIFHSPIVWGQFSHNSIVNEPEPSIAGVDLGLTFASSEDIIQHVYDWFLTGDLHSRQMAQNWKDAMVERTNYDLEAGLSVFPDSAFFRILGSAYELDQDEQVYNYGNSILQAITGNDDADGLPDPYIYGLHTDREAGTRTRMFSFLPDGSSFQVIANQIVISGEDPHLTALAIRDPGTAYAFQYDESNDTSRLVTFVYDDPSIGGDITATVIGEPITGFITGADFDEEGSLWVLNSNSTLCRVDIETGGLHSSVNLQYEFPAPIPPLSLNGDRSGGSENDNTRRQGFAPNALAIDRSGKFYVGVWAQVYAGEGDYVLLVNPETGETEMVFTETDASGTEDRRGIVAMAFSPTGDAANELFTVTANDLNEIFKYNAGVLPDGASRQSLFIDYLQPDSWYVSGGLAAVRARHEPQMYQRGDTTKQNFGKAGEGTMALYYYYTSTGDPLALELLGRRARGLYRYPLNQGQFEYDSRISKGGLVSFVAEGRETNNNTLLDWAGQWALNFGRGYETLADQELTPEMFDQTTMLDWRHSVIAGQDSISHGLPVALKAVHDRDNMLGSSPVALKLHPTENITMLLKKETNDEAFITVAVRNNGDRLFSPKLFRESDPELTREPLPIEVVDRWSRREDPADTLKVTEAWSSSIWFQYTESHHFIKLRIPASVGPDIYILDLGDKTRYAVLESDIPKILHVAPDGMPLTWSRRYYFDVPSGTTDVDFFVHRQVRIFDPDGVEVEIQDLSTPNSPSIGTRRFDARGLPGTWSLVTDTDSDANMNSRHQNTNLRTTDSFIRFLNIPLVIAIGSSDRLFDVDTAGYRPFDRSTLEAPPLADPFHKVEGHFDTGGMAVKWQWFDFTELTNIPTARGTLEFWVQSLQSVADTTFDRPLRESGSHFFRMDPFRLSHQAIDESSGTTGRYIRTEMQWDAAIADGPLANAEMNCRAFPIIGRWHHIAVTWNVDGVNSGMAMYIDGRRKVHYHTSRLMPLNTPASWMVPGDCVRFGSTNSSTANPLYKGHVLDELRISNVVRYHGDFTPPDAPFTFDDDTYLLMHCDGNADATLNENGTPVTITGQLVGDQVDEFLRGSPHEPEKLE